MSRIAITILATAAIFAAVPAVAQMGSSTSGSGSMSDSKMSGDMPTTCQGMMDKEMPMMNSMAEGNKKMMAMKEMNMAKQAMTAGHEKTCMMHMKKSMGMM